MANKTNMDQYFNRLVDNALDFLERAVFDFENELPKFSVINFYTAVELLLKARLFKEHWTLVVANDTKPNLDKFINGDFKSVSFAEATDKLEEVLKSGLNDEEIQTFKKVKAHRNKMVHFFHKADSEEENEKFLQTIAKEQLNAWYRLHRRLLEEWNHVFSDWYREIKRIDAKLKKHHEYLDSVFRGVEDEIKNKQKQGVEFRECPSCKFHAQEFEQATEEIYYAVCLVCDNTEKCLKMECPYCEESIYYFPFEQCEKCDKKLDPLDVASHLHEIDDYKYCNPPGNCSDCESFETVAQISDFYICVCCLEEFGCLDECGYCGQQNTGDMIDSLFSGCVGCEGKAGQI